MTVSSEGERYRLVRRALMDAENRLRSEARAACGDGETVVVHRIMEQAKAMSDARAALQIDDC